MAAATAIAIALRRAAILALLIDLRMALLLKFTSPRGSPACDMSVGFFYTLVALSLAIEIQAKFMQEKK
jgi:hypothetical protein